MADDRHVGMLPDGVGRVDTVMPYVWIIGRTKTDGPADHGKAAGAKDPGSASHAQETCRTDTLELPDELEHDEVEVIRRVMAL
jgi:hypothetical protein